MSHAHHDVHYCKANSMVDAGQKGGGDEPVMRLVPKSSKSTQQSANHIRRYLLLITMHVE